MEVNIVNIDFNKPIHIHFIGIGGISMSGLAEILLERGFTVSGSDSKESELTKSLEAKGCRIMYPQSASNITGSEDVICYTAAIKNDNPELSKCIELGIPLLTRAELLGQLMKNYEVPIAISGTHGKTTTTSMLSEIMIKAKSNPTISVGGILPSIGGNIRIGGNELFVTEACEYTNSFLSFFPKIAIILNVEEDHLDFFKDINDIRNSFRNFSKLLPSNGLLVINGEIPEYDKLVAGLDCRVISFGSNNSFDYWFDKPLFDDKAHATFVLHRPNGTSVKHSLSVPGIHNVYNAVAAIITAEELNIPANDISSAIFGFTGTKRRFEYKGSIGGVTIMDDYAHHPTEIRATLAAANECKAKDLWCVFQPHTYTRTKAFFEEFVEALSLSKHVVLADIYAARETYTLGISSKQICDALVAKGCDAYYFPSFDEIENFLLEKCSKDDMLITMGAGDIVKVGEHLLGI